MSKRGVIWWLACTTKHATKGAAMPDAQGVHVPEVPMPPQPEVEPTRATWMFEGKRICFHTLVHIWKTGRHAMRNYYKSEFKSPRKLRDCSVPICGLVVLLIIPISCRAHATSV